MTRATRWVGWLGVLLVGIGLSSAALAQGLRKLPPDLVMESSEGSPGKVTFSHTSHMDPKKPACLTCHPGAFRMLEPGTTSRRKPVSHAEMEKGRQCGLCHGKTAFGFDGCDLCHRG